MYLKYEIVQPRPSAELSRAHKNSIYTWSKSLQGCLSTQMRFAKCWHVPENSRQSASDGHCSDIAGKPLSEVAQPALGGYDDKYGLS